MPALSESDLIVIYRDLHAHPELGFQERRTAGIVAERLASWRYEVTSGIGGTGVVAVLDNGPGPTALLRADMDGLPVLEQTEADYASRARGVDREGNDVPVMHACGHDVHVTCLLGAAARLASERDGYAGRLMLVFQPAEELGAGARAMVEDGLFDRFGKPDVVLGQHVAPIPAGLLGLHAGPAMAASDSLTVTLHGSGGHGSRPETTVDPIVMAAATILRLQTIVSRETAGTETAVVTVGMVHAGSAGNVIPDRAELRVNVRSFEPAVRERTLAAIHRIVNAEAEASGAPRPPEIEHTDHFPVVVNDPDATARTLGAFTDWLVIDPGVVTGSEDVGVLATESGAPCVFWLLGGAAPDAFAGATTEDELREVVRSIPSNHSPSYLPVVTPTLATGVEALVRAAHAWLPLS
ncbi:amidohydrolase [Nocardioides pelophilus]|uniref:amidohydrolase n=1 Tax=Nocardioides pelophilus TaxID=2172019 RepID=UPI0015FFF84D|nr:amidohydrolase [Nocardioides pelophilus]